MIVEIQMQIFRINSNKTEEPGSLIFPISLFTPTLKVVLNINVDDVLPINSAQFY